MNRAFLLILTIAFAPRLAAQDPRALAKSYVDSVRKLNEAHARKPGKESEVDLRKRLPPGPAGAVQSLLKIKDSPALADALFDCAEAALDLDAVAGAGGFDEIRARLEMVSPEKAKKLGTALSRERFLLRGIGGLDLEYMKGFAEALEGVLSAYDELFAFKEWSKVPGKKLRIRLHLEEKIDHPPHFAPEHPFHSEIDFPVVDPKSFSSPTPTGQFLFYGLCHELGHAIAMWGNARLEEDRHAWAHYTGLAVVEFLSEKSREAEWMKNLRDVRWRSLTLQRKELAGKAPSLKDRDGVLSLLLALHDKVGPKAIGAAINHLDALDRRLRVNRVRYYTFEELQAGLLATLKEAKLKQEARALIESAGR